MYAFRYFTLFSPCDWHCGICDVKHIIKGVGKGGSGGGGVGRSPLFGGKFYTFPTQSVRDEMSAKTTFLKSII